MKSYDKDFIEVYPVNTPPETLQLLQKDNPNIKIQVVVSTTKASVLIALKDIIFIK